MKMNTPSTSKFSGIRRDGVLQRHPFHTIAASPDIRDYGIPEHLDVAVVENSLLEDLAGPQFIPAMGDVNLFAQLGQVEGLFRGTVAAANHHHRFAPEKKSVAGGAVGNAFAIKLIALRVHQVFWGCHRWPVPPHGISAIHRWPALPYGSPPRVQCRDFLRDHFQIVRLGVLGEFHGELGPADVGEARIILHFVTHGHLTAGDTLFDQHGFQCRAHGIYGGGQSLPDRRR
jgi:hypothetical protein